MEKSSTNTNGGNMDAIITLSVSLLVEALAKLSAAFAAV